MRIFFQWPDGMMHLVWVPFGGGVRDARMIRILLALRLSKVKQLQDMYERVLSTLHTSLALQIFMYLWYILPTPTSFAVRRSGNRSHTLFGRGMSCLSVRSLAHRESQIAKAPVKPIFFFFFFFLAFTI